MGRAYSADLRSLVIREVKAGSSARAAAVHFRLGVSTAIRWVERHRRTGSAAALPIPGSRSPLDAHRDWLLGLVRQTSELTLVKIQSRLLEEKGVASAIGSIWRFYDRNGYSFKRMARPVGKRFLRSDLVSLRQRIRSRDNVPAKMEIRASWSS